jgi:ferredoxin
MTTPANNPVRLCLSRSGKTIDVPADQTLLEALLEHGFDVASVCREGICGTCETAVLSGIPDHRDSILDDEERAANTVMMVCVSRALTPELELEL